MWPAYTDEELFGWQWVGVAACDLPGRPLCRVRCAQCGEEVHDERHREVGERLLCRACAGRTYHTVLGARPGEA